VIGRAAQAGYLLWPSKRRWSNRNFGHVLGLPPDHPEVRRLALRAYREYASYIVELMRLPSRPVHELANGVEAPGIDEVAEMWRTGGGPLIVTAGHVGSNEVAAAGLAGRGYPVSAVADDSSFPELFALLSAQRASWGVTLIPWRNLRAMFNVLRRNEMLALVVDWGYRFDGVPVQLFGAWTTLPAGPATLAAKTGATIVHIAIRRVSDGKVRMEPGPPIRVATTAPADIQRATQAIADALEASVRAAPEQWYSFKPLWPADPGESVQLEARANAMLADTRPAGNGNGFNGTAARDGSSDPETGAGLAPVEATGP
jgi:phosphatidylinositol dimannoside acyltransferase